jgi:hypothetical protein
VLTWACYFLAMWRWSNSGDFDWGIAASWAQVATAFSFAGAGVVALIGVANELRTRVPLVFLGTFEFDPKDGALHRGFTVENQGDETAYGINVAIRIQLPKQADAYRLHGMWADARIWRFRAGNRKRTIQTDHSILLYQERPRLVRLLQAQGYFRVTLVMRQPLPPRTEVRVMEMSESLPSAEVLGAVFVDNMPLAAEQVLPSVSFEQAHPDA